jgi:hypothetical protein
MNRKMIGEAIYIRVSDRKSISDSQETWKCAEPKLEWQIHCFPYGERSDVPWLQQVEQKAVSRQRNLGLHFTKRGSLGLTSLIPSLSTEVHVSREETEQSCVNLCYC